MEIAGPEKVRLPEIIGRLLAAMHDPRPVVAQQDTRYFGVALQDDTLIPGPGARVYPGSFADWVARTSFGAPTPGTGPQRRDAAKV